MAQVALIAAVGTDASNDVRLYGAGSFLEESASYSIVGSDSLNVYAINAISGTYAITGKGISTKLTPIVSGVYTLTGTAAGLRATRLLSAASGSYAITGTAASLRGTKIFSAAGGSYAQTGTTVGLRATRLTSISSGVYTISGTDTPLTYVSSSAGTALTLATMGFGR